VKNNTIAVIAVLTTALIFGALIWGAGSAVQDAYARGRAVGRAEAHAALQKPLCPNPADATPGK
jgi:hypothetical protein